MFQLSIQNNEGKFQPVGELMTLQEGIKWQQTICAQFPTEMVMLKKVAAQYIVPLYTVDEQPALVFIGREGIA